MFNIFKKKELKIGQIWTVGSDNPFEKDEFIVTILGIKGGYVYFESSPNLELDYMKDFKDCKLKESKTEREFRFLYKKLFRDINE